MVWRGCSNRANGAIFGQTKIWNDQTFISTIPVPLIWQSSGTVEMA